MGSLMAGWNSPTLSSKKGSLGRSRSLTRDEIDNFWKAKHESEEEHLKALVEIIPTQAQTETNLANESVAAAQASESNVEKDLLKLDDYKDWWTKSTWAFLNEPAIEGKSQYNYKSQHNVAVQATQQD